MNDHHADPEPSRTAGLQHGGSVPPGETPPAESGTTDTGPLETYNPASGWSRLPVALVALITAVFVAFFLTYAVFLV